MQWIDGSEIDFKQYTGEVLCEKLSLEMWKSCKMEQWSEWVDFIQVAYFIMAFDTELTMEGIFTFLENSIGHYAPQIIWAFREIGDDNDANILEYEITSFNEDHELREEIVERITELAGKLYLKTGFDIWKLLFDFVDRKIDALTEN